MYQVFKNYFKLINVFKTPSHELSNEDSFSKNCPKSQPEFSCPPDIANFLVS